MAYFSMATAKRIAFDSDFVDKDKEITFLGL